MLGVLRVELEDYFISTIGAAKWHEAIRISGLADADRDGVLKPPPGGDEALFRAVEAACEVTGADPEQLLAGFGRYFVNCLAEQGYDRVSTATL